MDAPPVCQGEVGPLPGIHLEGNPGSPVGHRGPEDSIDRRQNHLGVTADRGAERPDLNSQPGRLRNLDGGQNMGSRIALDERFNGELGGHRHRDIMPQI
mgnify:CR=1 FL=1